MEPILHTVLLTAHCTLHTVRCVMLTFHLSDYLLKKYNNSAMPKTTHNSRVFTKHKTFYTQQDVYGTVTLLAENCALQNAHCKLHTVITLQTAHCKPHTAISTL